MAKAAEQKLPEQHLHRHAATQRSQKDQRGEFGEPCESHRDPSFSLVDGDQTTGLERAGGVSGEGEGLVEKGAAPPDPLHG